MERYDCATDMGVDYHIKNGQSCGICKQWVKDGRPKTTLKMIKAARKPKPQPVAKQKPKPAPRKPREVKPCGSISAYDRHRRSGEQPCEKCLEAKRVYNRELAKKRRSGNHKSTRALPREHGSERGVHQHYRYSDKVCDLCKPYALQISRNKAAKRKAKEANK